MAPQLYVIRAAVYLPLRICDADAKKLNIKFVKWSYSGWYEQHILKFCWVEQSPATKAYIVVNHYYRRMFEYCVRQKLSTTFDFTFVVVIRNTASTVTLDPGLNFYKVTMWRRSLRKVRTSESFSLKLEQAKQPRTLFLHRGLGSTVVKVLCYKSEGRWFDPSWCQWIFHWHNPSDRTTALGSTQPLTETSTRSISWG